MNRTRSNRSKATRLLLLMVLLNEKPAAFSSCLLNRANFCSCDSIRRSVTCSNLDLPISEVLPFLIPSSTRVLTLRKNWIQENVALQPEHLQRLKSLELLDMSKNRIADIGSLTFRDFRYLRMINLSRNRIRVLDADVFIAPLPNLEHLNLADNRILLVLENTFGQISTLVELDLQRNPIVHLSSKAFEGLANLRTLKMSECNLTVFPSRVFSPLVNLRTLELRRWKHLWKFTDFAFKSNAKLSTLIVNGFKTLSSDGMTHNSLAGLFHLHYLALTACNLTSVPVRSLWSVRNLRILDLSENPFKVIRKRDFAQLPKLEKLILENCGLTEIEEFAFHRMLNLVVLNLSNNRLQTLRRISLPANVSNLISLDLSFNSWICDCRLQWLGNLNITLGSRSIHCRYPDVPQGIDLKMFASDFSPISLFCVPPKIEEFSVINVTKASAGSDITFPCIASGFPQPIITWHTPEGLTTSNETEKGSRHQFLENRLQIKSVRTQDAGIYRCVATNTAGDDVRTIELLVAGRAGDYDGIGQRDIANDLSRSVVSKPSTEVAGCEADRVYFNPLLRLLVIGVLGCLSCVSLVSTFFLAVWGHNNKRAKERLRSKIMELQKQVTREEPQVTATARRTNYHDSKRVTFGQSISSGYSSGFNSPNGYLGKHKHENHIVKIDQT